MSEHYYSKTPHSDHKPAHVSFSYRGLPLTFQTDSGVFSRLEIDKGTELLLCALPDPLSGKVLDMGCGYGVIGVSVGRAYPGCKVIMADINERAVGLAQANARENHVTAQAIQSDGYAALSHEERFDLILQNPPIRAGKRVIYAMFEEAARRLTQDGSFWLVIRKQQGAPSALAFLQTLFEDVETPLKKGGYWILHCAKPKALP